MDEREGHGYCSCLRPISPLLCSFFPFFSSLLFSSLLFPFQLIHIPSQYLPPNPSSFTPLSFCFLLSSPPERANPIPLDSSWVYSTLHKHTHNTHCSPLCFLFSRSTLH